MDKNMSCDFRVALPDQRVSIAITTSDRAGVQLVAALTGDRSMLVGCGTAARSHYSSAADAQDHLIRSPHRRNAGSSKADRLGTLEHYDVNPIDGVDGHVTHAPNNDRSNSIDPGILE
jgi:hypothetical protein